MSITANISSASVIGTKGKEDWAMKNQTNWIVGISDGNSHEYKIGNVTFTVLSEFWPKISGVTIYRSLCAAIIMATGELAAQPIISELMLLSRW